MRKTKKNRWSNYVPAPAANVVSLRPADADFKLTFTGDRGSKQTIDFSFMADRPQMASLFTRVMRVEGEQYAPNSRKRYICAVRSFNNFIKLQHPEIGHTTSLTHELLSEWAIWMTDVRKDAVQTASSKFNCIRVLLRAARALHPEDFQPAFDIPANVLPGAHERTMNARILSEEFLRELLHAAERDINEIRKKYRDGDVPEGPADLIPFMIVIGMRTAINPHSLYSMERTCLEPHVIDPTGFYVVWTKRRSKAGKQRQLHHANSARWGVVELLRFLMDYTQPLVDQAQEADRKMLFLYRNGPGSTHPGVFALGKRPPASALRGFCSRHNLPPFQMVQLRPSVATHYYAKTGGKLRKVQLLLGHARISTTLQYIGDALVQKLHNRNIRAAQDALVKRVTRVISKETKRALAELANELRPEQREKIADGAYDCGYGKCRNPFDSPQPGQRSGKCCTLFLACLTCPNALFFLEDLPRVISLRDYLLAERQKMRPEVWDILYQDRVKLIDEEIVGAFSSAQISRAKLVAANISDMPVLATMGVLK